MKTPKITIGILNRNGMKYLKRTIPRLLALNYNNKEIMVVDNASTDDSINFLKKFKKVKIIENKNNEGYGKGKNKLVKYSSGEYVLLLDNDILIEDRGILSTLIKDYQGLKNVSFISYVLTELGEEKTIHYGLFLSTRKREISVNKLNKSEIFQAGGFIGGFVFFNKSIFKKLGGYDEIYPFNMDDYDLSLRSYLRGYNIFIIPSKKVIHLGIGNRLDINSWSWKNKFYLSGFLRTIIKNYKLKNIIIWLPLAFLLVSYKTLTKFVFSMNLKVINSYFISFYYLIRDLPNSLKQRKIIQSKRKIKEDIFLKIKPPKFN